MHATIPRGVQSSDGFVNHAAGRLYFFADSLPHTPMPLGLDQAQELQGQFRLLSLRPEMREYFSDCTPGNTTRSLPIMPELVLWIGRPVGVEAPLKHLLKERRNRRIGACEPDLDVVVRRPMCILLTNLLGAPSDGNEPVRIDRTGEVSVIRGDTHINQYTNGESASQARVGKKAAGRLLDGREWSQMPEVPHAR